jgi:aspartyl-tRNA(Asn)/glutamyl-tRNA(Gln) amidotransferase subunit A
VELTDLSIAQAAERIARGELSPVELTEAHLDRIARLDERLNCFITLTPELALEGAHQAEMEILDGEWRGPLHGIPLALKDLYETAGVRTTAGAKFLANYVPETDAFTAQRLKAAGAVLLGKLNLHEIALGVTNNNPHYGASRNPWDLARIPGGSSGGSAAALAAGLCMGSLGSDTGGSIRNPAALCGVVGLKPTYGRVSLRGVLPLSWFLDHAGPMARGVRDVAILLGAIAGYDPGDLNSANVAVDDYLAGLEGGVRGWRIALASDDYFTWADGEVLAAVRAAAQVFEDLGARVEAVSFPEARRAAPANSLMVSCDAAAVYRERLAGQPENFGPEVRQRLQNGAATPVGDYILAHQALAEFRVRLERLFQEHELLLAPTTPITAPLIEGPEAAEQARWLSRFISPFNLPGVPALSVPCGFTSNGLPIGLQLVAPRWAEAALLRAGYAYEQATEWHIERPGL